MKIITTIRTLNAELFIEEFCSSYSYMEKILVADGGSKDNTVELAKQFPNVEVREFTDRVYRKGIWRNPHGAHINFLIDWAEQEEGADWIIFDDCDCYPNYAIKEDFVTIFEEAEIDEAEFILANRAYIYGTDKYFKELTCPEVLEGQYDSKFIPSLWAWKTGLGFRASEDDPFKHEFNRTPTDFPRKELYPPYALLHYFYPTDEYMQKKLKFYNKIYDRGVDRKGKPVRTRDPKDFGGKLLPLEDWMRK